MRATSRPIMWVLAVMFTVTSLFMAQSMGQDIKDAQAHNSGYVGTGCYSGYAGTSAGWAERDCLGYTYFGGWYYSNGYWYRYLYGGYYHYWWGVYYGTTERTMGYCWYNSYCVNYG